MKLLIVGHKQHGKDTVAQILREEFGFKAEDSSRFALNTFLFDKLKDKHQYNTVEEAYADRHNNRKEWFKLIQEYNREDKTKLAREIMKNSDIYVGMRDKEEVKACMEQNVFSHIIAVVDPRKPVESNLSMTLDPLAVADAVIYNDGTHEELRVNVVNTFNKLI